MAERKPLVAARTRALATVRTQMDAWQSITRALAALYAADPDGPPWAETFHTVVARLRGLTQSDADLAIYLLLQAAESDLRHYSVQHAMFTAVVVDLCAKWSEWPEEEVTAVTHAALTMNLGMTALQNKLAMQSGSLTPEQRAEIDSHPARSVELLKLAGVTDPLWLHTVQNHHAAGATEQADPALAKAQRLASLLRRADIFTAKLSRRLGRAGKAAPVAARDACLDGANQLDEIGATMLRVLGLYPPGSLVQLANGDVSIVTRRGDKAHMPTVVSLRRANGAVLENLRRHETVEVPFRVLGVMRSEDLRLRLQHDRILACG